MARRKVKRRRNMLRRAHAQPLSPSAVASSPIAFALLLSFLQSGSGSDDEAIFEHRKRVRRRSFQRKANRNQPSRPRREQRRGMPDPQRRTLAVANGGAGASNGAAAADSACHRQQKWHTSLVAPQECTNDGNFPPSWEQPPMRDKYLFDTWFACCEGMFAGPVHCGHTDVCTGSKSDFAEDGGVGVSNGAAAVDPACHRQRKWHTSLTTPQQCTNDGNFPPSWEQPPMRDKYLFDTWSTCCEGMFDGTVGCGHRDTCRNDVANDGFHTSGGHEISGCKGRMWHPDNSAVLPT